MSGIAVIFVDAYVVRVTGGGLEALVLRRSPGRRRGGVWEGVHGHIEPGEAPVAAALREVREESGIEPLRLYNLSRTELFYLHRTDEVAVIPVFAAIVDPGAVVQLSEEHDAYQWLPLEQARTTVAWPRERRALEDLAVLLADGTAGALEEVLRIEPPRDR